MGNQTFKFPSGMVAELRARSIAEMKSTLQAMVASQHEGIEKALTDATVRLVDPGPYPDGIEKNGAVDWSQTLEGDRIAGMVNMRIAAYRPKGHEYPMQLQCKHCPESFIWDVDLRPEPDGDVLVYDLAPDAAERFQNGEPSEYTIDGKLVKFLPLMAKHSLLLEKMSKGKALPDVDELSMVLRIIEVEGVEKDMIRRWIDSLGLLQQKLSLAMAEADCGIETTIEVYCPKCMKRYETELPFGADFWVPQSLARSRREKKLAEVRRGQSTD